MLSELLLLNKKYVVALDEVYNFMANARAPGSVAF